MILLYVKLQFFHAKRKAQAGFSFFLLVVPVVHAVAFPWTALRALSPLGRRPFKIILFLAFAAGEEAAALFGPFGAKNGVGCG